MTHPPGILPTWEGKRFRFAWDYHDTAGSVIGRVARYDDIEGNKDVIPYFVPNGTGFKAGGPPAPCSLFGLNTLSDPRAPVYLVEGEKAAAALHAMGLQAVTSIGGAKAANKTDWTPLRDFGTVYLLPDCDAPGEGYVRDVAGILGCLSGIREMRVSRLPGLPEHGDVVDFLQSRLSEWNGFDPTPMEPGSDIVPELLEAIEACAVAAPAEWVKPPVSADEEWEPPVSLKAATIPPWPCDVFPEPVQKFTDALAASTETPPELPAMMILAVLAAAAQGMYRVRVKTDYFEPVNLWTCCALPPGTRKSAVWLAATAPLTEWERERRAEMEPIVRRVESERKTLQGRIDRRRADAAKAKADAIHNIMQEIEALEADMPEAPRLPQVWCADITPENLPVIMEDNAERMALLSDEGGVFDTLAGRYSNGIPNLDVYLQGHAGSPVRVNRASRAPVFLERPALTIGITPQPDVVRALNDKPGFRGRGLLARFLYAMPESNLGRRTLQAAPMPDATREAYTRTVRAMLDLPWDTNAEGRPCAHVLRLSPEALELLNGFARLIEAGLAPGGTFEHVTDWAGKLPGAVVRVAAVFHVARHAHGAPWEHLIGNDDMAAAIRMAKTFEKHALIAFDAMKADAAMDDARAILQWICRENLKSFTHRECHKAHQHRFTRVPELNAPLEVLTERGFIRRKGERIGVGRPSLKYEVNPIWDRNATK